MSFDPHRNWHDAIIALSQVVRDSENIRIQGMSSTFVVEPDTAGGETALTAPSGILSYEPDELVLVAMGGTPMSDIEALLLEKGQRLKIPYVGSLGGAVATRRNGAFAIDNSTLPNTVLALGVVASDGTLFRTGGPTVKNVSGFDVTKVMVGSWGLLGIIAQATLRTEPIPRASAWLIGPSDSDTDTDQVATLYRPALVCRARNRTVVLLEGHSQDITAESKKLVGFEVFEGLTASEIVEINRPAGLHEHTNKFINDVIIRMREEFDPGNRLNRSLATAWELTT